MGNFKVYKVNLKLPVCVSVSPVHSLDDGVCHKRNLEGLARLFDGASPGPRAACLWVVVQCVGSKVPWVNY